MKNLILLGFLLISTILYAQIDDLTYRQIDSLFVEWNQPNHPGGAVGIMQDGQMAFSRAYGLASLEYLVPNTTETIFNVASISKQFTAMGIVLLHLEGKLSIDDAIRKYIPEMANFKDSISIRQMLHHTSGLRSLHDLLGFAGWRRTDMRSNEDLYRFMRLQRELNFMPGERFLYCNTGYIFLARIIEVVSGDNYADWMRQNVFEPLGLIHTYVEDKYNRVVPQNATSYHHTDHGFEKAVEYWNYVGTGNTHSTINDLLKWIHYFNKPKTGWEKAFQMMQTLDPLNDGSENRYAFGLFLDQFNGLDRIQHGGSIGGYRSFICTYPSEGLSIAVLINFSPSSPAYFAERITELILPGTASPEIEEGLPGPPKTIQVSGTKLEQYTGSYWSDDKKYVRHIKLEDDSLRYYRSDDNMSTLVPTDLHSFQMMGVRDKIIVNFKTGLNEMNQMHVSVNDESPILSQAFVPFDPETEDMAIFTGHFYCPEIQHGFSISTEDKQVFVHHVRHGDFEMKIINSDILQGPWPFNTIKYKRTIKGNTLGLYASNGRVWNLWYEKK